MVIFNRQFILIGYARECSSFFKRFFSLAFKEAILSWLTINFPRWNTIDHIVVLVVVWWWWWRCCKTFKILVVIHSLVNLETPNIKDGPSHFAQQKRWCVKLAFYLLTGHCLLLMSSNFEVDGTCIFFFFWLKSGS